MTPLLAWCDLETTGLSPERDRILEAAWFVTSSSFPFLSAGADATSALVGTLFDAERHLNAVTSPMHAKSGLLAALADPCRPVTVTEAGLDARLDTLAEAWPIEKDQKVWLAGSSVHFDLGFIRARLPRFARRLSHRCFDVSAVKGFCRSLGMPEEDPATRPEPAHRALEDLHASMRIAYRCEDWLRSYSGKSIAVTLEDGS